MYVGLGKIAVYFLSTLILMSLPAQTETYDLKVNEKTVERVESLLRNTHLPLAEHSPDEMEKLFRSRSSAHRLRLSQIYLEVSKNKDFLRKFPEFKPLVEHSGKTVRALLEHDAAKGLEITRPAIRVLSMLQGFDFRNSSPLVSAEVNAQLRKVLKDAIDDINTVDKKVMADSLKKISPDILWARKHMAMTDVLDFYDTFKSRQDELAKNGRKLSPPSEWLEMLEKEGAYSVDRKQENELKKRFARYLETTDPLKDPSRFSKADDFIRISRSNYAQDIENIFDRRKIGLRGRGLLKAAGANAKSAGKMAASSLKAAFVFRAGITAVEYVLDPESVSAESVVTELFHVGDTASCDTVKCAGFVRQCAAKIHRSDLSHLPAEVFKDPNSKICIDDFFRSPLEEQIEQRKDGNLNRMLSKFTPRIHHLTCQQDEGELVIQVDTPKFSGSGSESQKIFFDSTRSIQRITRKSVGEDHLFARGLDAQGLQHCRSEIDCRIFDMDRVRSEKLYFFKDESLPAVFEDFPRRVPVDSFRWARNHEGLIKFQAASLHDCCQRDACQKYFEERRPAPQSSISAAAAGAR